MKKIQNILGFAEDRNFLAFIELIPGGIFWKDLEGNYLGCNRHLVVGAGFSSRQDIVGKNDSDLFTAEQVKILQKHDEMVAESKSAVTFEEQVTMLSGKVYVFFTQKMPILDEFGEVCGIVGVSLDITTGSQLFKSIIDSIPGSIYWKSVSGKYLGCNQHLVNVSGLKSKSELIDKTDEQLWPNSAKKLRENDLKVIETKSQVNIEEEIVFVNGQHRVFAVQKVPLIDSNGGISGVVGVSLDVTSSSEKKQQVLVDVSERLKQSQIREEQFKAMAALSGMLAHELKTPLASIKLTASSFQDSLGELVKGYRFYAKEISGTKPIQADRVEKLEYALQNVEHSLDYVSALIRNVLTGFSTINSEKTATEKIDLHELLYEAIEQYPLSDEQRSLINFKLPSKPLFTIADKNSVIHVIHNLIKNSLQAIKEAKKGEIYITTQYKKKCACIHFKDTAMGMPEEIRDKIFEPYFTTKRKSSVSIGLGLYFCKLVMQKMNGSINCEVKQGEYTLFNLYFYKTTD